MFRDLLVSAPSKLILFGEHAIVPPFSHLGIATSLGDLQTQIRVRTESSPAPSPFASPQTVLSIHSSYDDISDLRTECVLSSKDPLLSFLYDRGGLIKMEDCHHELLSLVRQFVEARAIVGDEPESDRSGGDSFALIASLYLLGLLSADFEEFSSNCERLEISVNSAVSASGGLGSSASFAVALSGAMSLVLDSSSVDSSMMDWRDRIGDVAHSLERIVHGNPSGLDGLTCCHGGLVAIEGGNVEKLVLSNPRSLDELRLLVVDTRVRRATGRIVEAVSKFPNVGSLLRRIGAECSIPFVEMIESGFDGERFGDLVRLNRELLDELDVLNHPSLTRVYEIADEFDLPAKLTGAGAGGCAFVSLCTSSGAELENELIARYEEEGFGSFVAENLGGDGVVLERDECGEL